MQRVCDKYGLENLSFEVLEYCDVNDLIKREQYYLDVLNPTINICKVARVTSGIKYTDEQRYAMSGANHHGYGKPRSEETKQKIRDSQKGELSYWYGKKQDENQKRARIAKVMSARRKQPVFQYDMEGQFIREYETAVVASKTTGIAVAAISRCLFGDSKTAGGYQWMPGRDNRTKEYYRPTKGRRGVVQYDNVGQIIREWESIRMAATNIGISYTSILCSCLGTKKTGGGFIWKYAGDDDLTYHLRKHQPKKIPVLQCDIEGRIIAEYPSIEEASEATKHHKSSIYRCLRGKYKQNKGFIWKYKDQSQPTISSERVIQAEDSLQTNN